MIDVEHFWFINRTGISSMLILMNRTTVHVPIKDAALIQKSFFYPLHYDAFHQNSSTFDTLGCTRFSEMHLFWVNLKDAATIQERPLLAQVRPLLARVRYVWSWYTQIWKPRQ